MELSGRLICGSGHAGGPLLVLSRPISFWGGVDPLTGVIVDPRHPDHGRRLPGTILVMERSIGSSSSSAIMLELLRNGVAPAAIGVGSADAILVLGVLVGEELGYPSIPMLQVGGQGFARLRDASGRHATIRGGVLAVR